MAWKPVVAAYSNSYDETVRLTVHDLASGAAQTIVSNRIHPFYVSHGPELLRLIASGGAAHDVATGGTWVEAQHLEVGARLFNEDGSASIVTAKYVQSTPLRAYNLTVADLHTYFVASNDNAPAVWVRNCIESLKLLHSEVAILSNRSAFNFWSRIETDGIIKSLLHGATEQILVKPNGTVMNGNTRLWIIQQKGYDINKLIKMLEPRPIYR